MGFYALLLVASAALLGLSSGHPTTSPVNSTLVTPRNITPGRCTFTATVSQRCEKEGWWHTDLTMSNFRDGASENIDGLSSEPGNVIDNLSSICESSHAITQDGTCPEFKVHGIGSTNYLSVRWVETGRAGIDLSNHLAFSFNNCGWQEASGKGTKTGDCGNGGTRGEWSADDHFCQKAGDSRKHSLDMVFAC